MYLEKSIKDLSKEEFVLYVKDLIETLQKEMKETPKHTKMYEDIIDLLKMILKWTHEKPEKVNKYKDDVIFAIKVVENFKKPAVVITSPLYSIM